MSMWSYSFLIIYISGDIRYSQISGTYELPANLPVRCILPPFIDYSIQGTGTDRYLSNIPHTGKGIVH